MTTRRPAPFTATFTTELLGDANETYTATGEVSTYRRGTMECPPEYSEAEEFTVTRADGSEVPYEGTPEEFWTVAADALVASACEADPVCYVR